MNNAGKTIALVALGLFFLYFGWLFSATGIFVGGRGGPPIVAADDPERFAYAVGIVFLIGAVSVVAGVVLLLRR